MAKARKTGTHSAAAEVLGSVTESTEKVPLYNSRPAAGFPAPGDDSIDRALDINDLVVKNPASTFFVRVEGDSMEGAGIFSGDVLVVDRSVTPKDGKIVVAAVYGEMVVKRLATEKGMRVLVSEKEGYEPLVVSGSDDVFIWGTVVGSVRVF
jgi:DNA polymerase V